MRARPAAGNRLLARSLASAGRRATVGEHDGCRIRIDVGAYTRWITPKVEPFNSQSTFPELPANRTYRGHVRIDAIDPKPTSRLSPHSITSAQATMLSFRPPGFAQHRSHFCGPIGSTDLHLS